MIRCVICCGGTGGHLSPGIALAEALEEHDHKATLVVSTKEVDSRLLKNYPELDYVKTPGRPFSWKPHRLLAFAFSHTSGFIFALRYLRKERPDVLIGFGGFSTVGMALAAFLLNVPIVLHEANRCPGRAIRLLSSIATRIYLPPGVRLQSIVPKTVRYYGYPVRNSIERMPADEARESMGMKVRGRLLLVLGGSQGANSLNEWVREHFEALAEEGINVCCVTGINKGNQRMIEHKSREGHIVRAYFIPFCDQMGELLSGADLTIARAGAGSIAEFMRCRLPSILVPYPYAADQHQHANAHFLEKQGGAVVLEEANLQDLQAEVLDVIRNEWLMASMRRNLELLDRGNSIDLIVQDIEQLALECRKVRESSSRNTEEKNA